MLAGKIKSKLGLVQMIINIVYWELGKEIWFPVYFKSVVPIIISRIVRFFLHSVPMDFGQDCLKINKSMIVGVFFPVCVFLDLIVELL